MDRLADFTLGRGVGEEGLHGGQFDDRVRLFVIDPTNPKLRVHPLKGSYAGYWSMNVNGDIRALYTIRGEEIILFALIGTHSELYGL